MHERTAEAVRAQTGAPVVATGPFVAPSFRPDPARRATVRESLGIQRDEVVALVVAGAWGVGELAATVRDLDHIGGTTPVVVCGDNARLVGRLRSRARHPEHVLGFVGTMPDLMDAADVLVENAGGLTAMEAFASQLPVITYRPIAAHGTDNARAMSAAGVTRFAHDRNELAVLLSAVALDGPLRRSLVDAGRHVIEPDAADVLLATMDPTRSVEASRDLRHIGAR